MGFSRAQNPALAFLPALPVPFVLRAEPLMLTATPLAAAGEDRVPEPPVTSALERAPVTGRASFQTMVNQSLTAEAAPPLSHALSPPLVNARARPAPAGQPTPAPEMAAEEAKAAETKSAETKSAEAHADEDDNPEDYAVNHWRRHESEAEHAFRVMRAEEEAQALFARATVKQKQAYDAVMANLRGLRAPRYDRTRAAALRVWRDATQDARTLYFRTCDVLMREGEMSENLDRSWTRQIDPARAATLWGDD